MNLQTLIIALKEANRASCEGDPASEDMLNAIIADLEKEAAQQSEKRTANNVPLCEKCKDYHYPEEECGVP